ncbi:MAG: T9SS type A sorting domain-containing protein, partial [Flavobacteriales bacterium]|nr:T9SS type A sorting domain-containing protein [Flavobacteriales bacterium]
NPTKEHVFINLETNSIQNASIDVFDLLGNAIISQQVNQQLVQINTNNIPQGIYLIKFTNEIGSIVFKLVKN